MTRLFGPDYFRSLPKAGLGIGLNPSDGHEAYLRQVHDTIDYMELTVSSSREQGPVSYTDVRRKLTQTQDGFQYMRISDYPPNIRRIIHSTNVNPVYPEPVSEESYAELRRLVEETKSPWVTEDLGIWLMSERHVYPFFMPLPLTQEALVVAIDNVNKFQEKIGVPFNAEFPPMRVVAGDMHAFDFFRLLIEATGCGMCLDIGHVLSYQLERGASPTADLHLLPWDSITELHVAGGNIDLSTDGFHYDDNHGDFDIVNVCYDMMDTAIQLATNLKAITLEVFGAKYPQLAIKKLRGIRNRQVVQRWLSDSPKETITLPELSISKHKVRESVIDMYDVLHSAKPVSGCVLEGKSASFLELFAVDTQRRWDYERQARLRMQGMNVQGYFPLTTKWLQANGMFPDQNILFARLLDAMSNMDAPFWEKVTTAYQTLVHDVDTDLIAQELLRCETWMNHCAVTGERSTQDFQVDVLKLSSVLNRSLELGEPQSYHVNVTLSHIGDCHFGRVSTCDLEFEEQDAFGIRGKSECCTGK